jgi:serine/threonine-protein phosphatase 2A regulatory subunit B
MADDPHNFKFSQCFGDKGDIVSRESADIITTVEFDHTGEYLATGDRGGRVVLFERNQNKKNSCEYRFHMEFQSHDAEFDYLKSLGIEEKINKIKWCKRTNQAQFLLSTNDKTIKLWKIYEKQIRMVSENNLSEYQFKQPTSTPNSTRLNLNNLKLPRLTLHDKIIAATPKKIYSNAHAYHINSISINSDGETFISSDDLRINLWNLQIPDQSFNIVDIKPANMEELTEVITSSEFNPQSCNEFMYSSSKGTIKLADMRENALCDSHSKVFEEYIDPANHNFFTEITSSISDAKFSADGRYIASRDYMTVKIWDVKMEREPIKTIKVHEHLREKLCDTYENDSIFDKFECAFSGDGNSVVTGSYNNNFMIFPDVKNPDSVSEEISLQADRSAFKSRKQQQLNNGNNKRKNGVQSMLKRDLDFDSVNFRKGILHLSWHPFENSVAIATTSNLYIFSTL